VQVLERVSSGKAHGIINVVSWGYHALDQQRYEDTSYYVPGMSQQEFLSVYLNTRRQEEINVADVLADELEDNFNKPLWMITVCTKQDLWWTNRTQVEAYYKQGQYNSIIDRIVHVRGAHHFNHHYCFVSLAMNNMTTESGQVLAGISSGYDQMLQEQGQRELKKIVHDWTQRYK